MITKRNIITRGSLRANNGRDRARAAKFLAGFSRPGANKFHGAAETRSRNRCASSKMMARIKINSARGLNARTRDVGFRYPLANIRAEACVIPDEFSRNSQKRSREASLRFRAGPVTHAARFPRRRASTVRHHSSGLTRVRARVRARVCVTGRSLARSREFRLSPSERIISFHSRVLPRFPARKRLLERRAPASARALARSMRAFIARCCVQR